MKVLVVEPMKECYTKEINGLEEMQALVGGYIQAIYPFPDKAAVVCNEEGKNLGLPFNRPLLDENDLPYDIICGTFFVAGLGVEDFVSLTEEQIRRYKEHYDRVMVLTATKETTPQHKPPPSTQIQTWCGTVNTEEPMTNYDLTSIGAVSASAKLAHIRANQELEQSSYNAAWLHGYADALTNVADALEHQQELMDSIIGCMGEQYDSAELYDILHNALAMSDEDILSLGFDLPQCHEYDAEISRKRPKGRKFALYER